MLSMSRASRLWAAIRPHLPQRELRFEDLIYVGDISPVVQNHLKNVFKTLFQALACFNLGYALHIYTNLGGKITSLGAIGNSVWLWLTPPGKEVKRARILMITGFFIGASSGWLIETNISKGTFQRNFWLAFIGTAVVFGCFAMMAGFSKTTGLMYSVSAVFSIYVLLVLFHVASASYQLYFWFIWFIGSVVAYSQEMVAQVSREDYHYSYTQHAIGLFSGIIAVSLHINHVMLRQLCTRPRRQRQGGTRRN